MTVNVRQEPKGSSVEYYKDRLVEIVIKWDNGENFEWSVVRQKIADYQNALSASPDPEGEWHWVPNEYVIFPKWPTSEMAFNFEFGVQQCTNPESSKFLNGYEFMIEARPPVPKKKELS